MRNKEVGDGCIGCGIFTGTPLQSVCFPAIFFIFCLILGIFQVIIDKENTCCWSLDSVMPWGPLVNYSLVRSVQNVKLSLYSLNFIQYLQKIGMRLQITQIWPAAFEINLIISSDGNVPFLLPSKYAQFTNTASHLPRCPAVFMQSANIMTLPESEPNVEGHNAQGWFV